MAVKVVDEDDDLILISNDGVIIRIRVSDVNVMSRYAGGVKVMRVQGDARVVTFARADHEEEEEIAEVETAEESEPTSEEIAELQAQESEIDASEAADELIEHAQQLEEELEQNE